MKAFDYLKSLPVYLRPFGIKGRASNGELKRWLENKSIAINGKRPLPGDEVNNIWQLVFFPNSKRQTTLIEQLSLKVSLI